MDAELIQFAQQFTDSFDKMATAIAKIGKMTDKLMTKIDEAEAKRDERHSKYSTKSGDQFKLTTDITIPAKEKDIDPDKRAEDEVIKAGTIVTANITVRHNDLVYQLVYKEVFITVSGYELRELLEGGLLEEV